MYLWMTSESSTKAQLVTRIVFVLNGQERSPQQDVVVITTVVIQYTTICPTTSTTSYISTTQMSQKDILVPLILGLTQTRSPSTFTQMKMSPTVIWTFAGFVFQTLQQRQLPQQPWQQRKLNHFYCNNQSLSLETCSEHHAGYEEFLTAVLEGIARGLDNDINDFSKQPGLITQSARRRVANFKTWLTRIFRFWYEDVTDASNREIRECLTDNFPYDSPGNLNKDCVAK